MKFKLDENLPARAVDVLRAAGHDAVNLLDQVPAGAEDAAVALLVQHEGRVLITLDLDFADIRAYEPGKYPGIVVLRPRRASGDEVVELLTRLAQAIASNSPESRLWIVDEHRIRIRGESS
jgi:predicted nuclease of predicted toxin-antitoxin system